MGIGQVLFGVSMNRVEVKVNKNAKENKANIQASWTNKLVLKKDL